MIDKFQRAGKLVAGIAAAAAAVVMALLYRRRGEQLRAARVDALEAKHAVANEKREAAIAALEERVEAREKDALTKTHLLRDLLDPGDKPGSGDGG
jgi:hypothetical protein